MNLQAMLSPISDTEPSGADLSYSPLFDQVREARRADDPSLAVGDWVTSLKTADWNKVRRLCEDTLSAQTKDLQLAVWYAEALARTAGFAGVETGLGLIGGMIDQYWESLWPALDVDDLDERMGKLEWLNGQLGHAIREIALTSDQTGAYDYLQYKRSREIENLGLKDSSAREAAIAEGGLAGDVFDKAVQQSGAPFYITLTAQLAGARSAFETLDQLCDQRFGHSAPNLSDIRAALKDCAEVADRLLEQCGGQPQAATTPAADESAPSTDHVLAAAVAMATPAAAPAGVLQTRAQAVQQLRNVAVWFRQNEPHSPVSLLAERAARWAEMPLEDWLKTVIKDDSTLHQLRELLDIRGE